MWKSKTRVTSCEVGIQIYEFNKTVSYIVNILVKTNNPGTNFCFLKEKYLVKKQIIPNGSQGFREKLTPSYA